MAVSTNTAHVLEVHAVTVWIILHENSVLLLAWDGKSIPDLEKRKANIQDSVYIPEYQTYLIIQNSKHVK